MANDYFSNQKRLKNQEREAMKGLRPLGINKRKPVVATDERHGKMPGTTTYKDLNPLQKLLNALKITNYKPAYTNNKGPKAPRKGYI